MQFKLTKDQFEILVRPGTLSEELLSRVSGAECKNSRYFLDLTDDEASDIREMVGERLMEIGFVDVHTVNRDGEILESLIDKFFVDEEPGGRAV